MASNQSKSIDNAIKLLALVSIVAIISIMICCLTALGFNSKVTVQKEKIEVSSQQNSNQL